MKRIIRRFAILLLVVFPWLWVYLLHWYSASGSGIPGSILRTANPNFISLGGWILFAYWCGAAAFVVIQDTRRQRGRLVIYALIVFILLPFVAGLFLLGIAFHALPKIIASLRTSDGHVFHVQHAGAFQGTMYLFTEEVSRNRFLLHSRVVGRIHGDYQLLVKLVPPKKMLAPSKGAGWPSDTDSVSQSWKLLSSPNERIIVAIYEPPQESRQNQTTVQARMAYDLAARKFYGDGLDDEYKSVDELSPFVLVGSLNEPEKPREELKSLDRGADSLSQ